MSMKMQLKIQKNFKNNNLIADIRSGNLFEPWKEKKFDYIINDVSAISRLVAEISPWFGKNIPCESGDDGTDLALSILQDGQNFLHEGGTMQIPLISLSNVDKIIDFAKSKFLYVKITKSKSWFMPEEMIISKISYQIKIKKLINFEEKFGKFISVFNNDMQNQNKMNKELAKLIIKIINDKDVKDLKGYEWDSLAHLSILMELKKFILIKLRL